MKKKFLRVVSAVMVAVMLMLVPGVSAFAFDNDAQPAVVAQSERPSDMEMLVLLVKILAEGFSGYNRMDSQDPVMMHFTEPFYRWCVRGLDEYSNNWFDINMDYDEEKNDIKDDADRGIISIGFDYDIDQGIYYSAHNPWMRKLGYCEFYDRLGHKAGYNLGTKRFKFDYNGYEWMFQVWKGEYLYTSVGAEMGLYYREPGSTKMDDFYYTIPDELMIDMEMKLYHNDEYLFTREMEKTWWQTGFVFNRGCEKPEDVDVYARVEWPDAGMRDAFLGALEGQGYVLNETYFIDGNIVSFAY